MDKNLESMLKKIQGMRKDKRTKMEEHREFLAAVSGYIPEEHMQDRPNLSHIIMEDLFQMLTGYDEREGYDSLVSYRMDELQDDIVELSVNLEGAINYLGEYIVSPPCRNDQLQVINYDLVDTVSSIDEKIKLMQFYNTISSKVLNIEEYQKDVLRIKKNALSA